MELKILKNTYNYINKMKTIFNIKNKIFNHLLINGEKEVCEMILFKMFKELQKASKKKSKRIITTAISLAAPSFKLLIFTRKKRKKKFIREVPYFLLNSNVQVSFAIRQILKALEKKSFYTHKNLKDEFLIGTQNLSKTFDTKKLLHNTVTLKKNLLTYYKW